MLPVFIQLFDIFTGMLDTLVQKCDVEGVTGGVGADPVLLSGVKHLFLLAFGQGDGDLGGWGGSSWSVDGFSGSEVVLAQGDGDLVG